MSVWGKVLDWLNQENPPPFSLDPDYRQVTATPAPGSRPQEAGRGPGAPASSRMVSEDVGHNLEEVRKMFHAPATDDIRTKEFVIPAGRGVRAAFVFVDALVDERAINEDILRPLLDLDPVSAKRVGKWIAQDKIEEFLPSASARQERDLGRIAEEILGGSVALFVQGLPAAVLAEVKGWEKRAVSTPQVERAVRGPHQAFVEALSVNMGLVRRLLRTPDLVCEIHHVGDLSRTAVAIICVKGVANERLVDEVRRRVVSIRTSYVAGTEMLDQLLDEPRFSLIPSTLSTERPDRLANHLAEGYVGIIADHSPFAAIVPSTIMTYVNHPEDFYVRWPYGTFIRLLRIVGAFVAMLVSPFYVAAMNFHPEMLPSNLLLTIAATREAVPIPLVVEVLGAEIAFDFIREAGIRVPSPIGPTIGIVGALLVGEAAVRASLLTPEVVIIPAVSGIALFSIPNQEAAFVIRLMRFVYIFAASFMGFVGLASALYIKLLYMCSIRNFGVPFMAPFAPRTATGIDLLIRGPLWRMEERPGFLRPESKTRQPPVARRWLFGMPGLRRASIAAGLRKKARRRGTPEDE